MTDAERRFYGILCTYRRPDLALSYLDALERQSLPPDVVVVVDNGSDRVLAAAIEGRLQGEFEVRYLDPEENTGPAGAFRLGFEEIESALRPDDLVVHFDDDDPPVRDELLRDLVGSLDGAFADDPSVGGIGLSGGRLSRPTGFVRPPLGEGALREVDHLHGGYLPIYRGEALSAVGSHDPTFWYGFEELELGLRLTGAGYRLLVQSELMGDVQGLYPKRSSAPQSIVERYAADSGMARFHKERNLVRILRREGCWLALLPTCLFRNLLRPLFAVARAPAIGWARFQLGCRACLAGLRGDTGLDPRHAPSSPDTG